MVREKQKRKKKYTVVCFSEASFLPKLICGKPSETGANLVRVLVLASDPTWCAAHARWLGWHLRGAEWRRSKRLSKASVGPCRDCSRASSSAFTPPLCKESQLLPVYCGKKQKFFGFFFGLEHFLSKTISLWPAACTSCGASCAGAARAGTRGRSSSLGSAPNWAQLYLGHSKMDNKNHW